MFTFSQLVDDLVTETRRPDLQVDIARYLNQTIREVHFDPSSNAAILYPENFAETLLTAVNESGENWDIPNPTRFQAIAGVKYPTVFDSDNNPVWARSTMPGRHLNQIDYYFYRVGSTFVFSGYGGVDGTIAIGYYEYPRALSYLAAAARPATYTEESGWAYAAGIDTPELQEAARLTVSNWLLLRWNQVIAEGLRAKVYKRTSDTERARTSYSLYTSLRRGLYTSETGELTENA